MKRTFFSTINSFKRVTTSSNWMPEVDGLRFLAIAWVILFHLQGSFLKKTTIVVGESNIVSRIFLGGDQGVLLFFVISGFILCIPFARHQLLKEKKVRLVAYYWRRVVRIEPPYIITCILIFIILVIRQKFTFNELFPHLGASLFYLHSILYHETSLINVVFWSLEVEVQFYLLAPFLTFLYFKFPANVRRIGGVILIFILPQIQACLLFGQFTLLYFLQYFIVGFMVCDIYLTRKVVSPSTGQGKPWLEYLPACLLIVMLLMNSHQDIFQQTLLPFVMGLFFLSVLFVPTWKKFFSIEWIAIIGGMCYSIYLIHFQIIAAVGDYSMKFVIVGDNFYVNFLIQVLIIIPIVLLISAGFYRLIERPFMRMKL